MVWIIKLITHSFLFFLNILLLGSCGEVNEWYCFRVNNKCHDTCEEGHGKEDERARSMNIYDNKYK
jgi:hypothetical protein